jgi:cellulose 1,4-beta-cellobiosidase
MRSTQDRELTQFPGCGINGALYFVKMDADGGLAKYSTNKAGAPYGTGYCDAQCPRDLKFIAGKVRRQLLLVSDLMLTYCTGKR